jgi:NAD(P)-dependent dehydrogenase (short-subunit alcohol dehydrogenase family)
MRDDGKKVCLLTGAGGRLGSMFCSLYASQYHIVAVYRTRRPDALSQHERYVDPLNHDSELSENEKAIYTVNSDLTVDGEISRIVDITLARYDRIDLLVNAAAHSVWAPIIDSNLLLDNLALMFQMNAIVPLQLATEVARRFWRNCERENIDRNRNVINVSSTAGVYIYRGQGQSGYSASKAALNNLTCHLANEFHAFGVRVNALAPNSFPNRISTESVSESIVRLDQGNMSGKILVLDVDGETLI